MQFVEENIILIKENVYLKLFMTSSIDFLSSPFQSELISVNKDKKSMLGSLKRQIPIQFVASNTHFLLLNYQHQLYGFGSNNQHQISSKKLSLFTLPIKVDLVNEKSKILEIACGNDFSAILTDDQEIEVFGCIKCKIQKSNIRGLSASNKKIAFAYEINKVYVGTVEYNSGKSKERKKNEIKSTTYDLPASILKTVINDFLVAALDQNGNVYVLEFGNDSFSQISEVNGISISASHNTITILSKKIIYVFECQSKKVSMHYLPASFIPVLACSSFSDIFALSEDGRVSHALIDQQELSTHSKQYRSIQKCSIDKFNSISYISMDGNSTIFIKGNPDQFNYELIPEISPLKSGTHVQTINFNDTFICCTNKTAYFKSTTIPYSNLAILLSIKHIDGSLYFTPAQEPINLINDEIILKKFNLSIGDTIKMKSKSIMIGDDSDDEDDGLLTFEIAGVCNGEIWARPFKSGYVICLPSNCQSFDEMFQIVEKPETLKNWLVNGYLTTVDTSSSSLEELGYSLGDLIWHQIHGIVEVVGSKSGKLVLLEFANRTLFTEEAIEMKILRKSENNTSDSKSGKSHKKSKKAKSMKMTRKVVDINGEVISLDISSGNGPRVFLPTDRVLSPLGEATILGFNENPYIQTDEMRMNGYEAVMANIFDLKLIRRINGIAVRTVNISKSSSSEVKTVKVSLNTEDSLNGLLPGDKLQIDDKYATVIGFTEDDETVIQYKGAKKCCFLNQPFTIIYRADINAVRKSALYPPAFVGSPMIQESAFLPGDIVSHKSIGEALYLGYSKNHIMFLLPKTEEILTFGFSLLLLPDYFEVIQRPVLDFWNDEEKE